MFALDVESVSAEQREGMPRSEYGAVFTGEHDPDRACVLRVGIHPHSHCKPHMVTTATHYLLTELGPVWMKTHRN